MSSVIKRDTIIKFRNLSGEHVEQNGKYGLVRKQLDDGRYRIMQTAGHDRAMHRINCEVQDIDLNAIDENGVVLVFPPSTGKTGINPVAILLPEFLNESSAGGFEVESLKIHTQCGITSKNGSVFENIFFAIKLRVVCEKA